MPAGALKEHDLIYHHHRVNLRGRMKRTISCKWLYVVVIVVSLPSPANAAPVDDISELMRQNQTQSARALIDSYLAQKNIEPAYAFQLSTLGVENFFLAGNSIGAANTFRTAKEYFHKMSKIQQKTNEHILRRMENKASRCASQAYMEIISLLDNAKDEGYYQMYKTDKLYSDLIDDRSRFVRDVAKARHHLSDGETKSAIKLVGGILKKYPDLLKQNQNNELPDTHLNRAIQYAYLFLAQAYLKESDIQKANGAVSEYLARIDPAFRPELTAWFTKTLSHLLGTLSLSGAIEPVLTNFCKAVNAGNLSAAQAAFLNTSTQYDKIPSIIGRRKDAIRGCKIDEVFIDTAPRAGSRAFIKFTMSWEGVSKIVQLNDPPMDMDRRHSMPDAWQAYMEKSGSGPLFRRGASRKNATLQFDGSAWKIEYVDF